MTLNARTPDRRMLDEMDEAASAPATFGRRDARGGPAAHAPGPIEEADEVDDEDGADAAPAPRRRRSRAARRPSIVFLNFCMSAAMFGALAAVGAFAFGRAQFAGAGPLATDTTFTVREGATLTGVAQDLESRGLISDGLGPVSGADLFTFGARVLGDDRAVKTGEFAVPAGASMATILNELTEGSPIEFRVTVPEGLTVYQALERIAAHPELTGDMPATLPPEGRLAAETVNFVRGESRTSVIDKLTAIQERRVAEAFAERSPDAPVETPGELLTLASIIEKETGLPEERPLVAGVFANRVRENWHLNTDPTLIYGVFGGKGLPDGRPILQSDKEDRNPYNTYIFRGLPPGPIAIPGEAALRAAANPAETDAMYFVADGTGGHAFSATADEHNRYVADLRRRERERRDAPAEPEGTTAEETTAEPRVAVTIAADAEASPSAEAVPAASEASVAVATDVSAPDAALDAALDTSTPAEPVPAGDPPGFVRDGIPAPGIPVPLTRPRG